jgi:hypothetical protein
VVFHHCDSRHLNLRGTDPPSIERRLGFSSKVIIIGSHSLQALTSSRCPTTFTSMIGRGCQQRKAAATAAAMAAAPGDWRQYLVGTRGENNMQRFLVCRPT